MVKLALKSSKKFFLVSIYNKFVNKVNKAEYCD